MISLVLIGLVVLTFVSLYLVSYFIKNKPLDQSEINYSCETKEDCVIKNVGCNEKCGGYEQACVNENSIQYEGDCKLFECIKNEFELPPFCEYINNTCSINY